MKLLRLTTLAGLLAGLPAMAQGEPPLNAAGTVLLEIGMNEHTSGTNSLEELRDDCQRAVDAYKARYLYTICEYHQKDWEDTYWEGGVATSDVVIGYTEETTTSYYSDRSSGSARRGGGWHREELRGRRSSSGGYTHTSVVPVMGTVQTPYHYSYTVPKTVYGLRVIGVVDRLTAPWREVESSLTLAFRRPLAYSTESLALGACGARLVSMWQSAEAFRYLKARCRASELPEGRFYYVVETQSPFF